MLLVSMVDKTIKIPKAKSSFPNKEDWEFNFKAGVPLEVPEEVAKSYAQSYPQVYQIVDSKDKIKTKEEKSFGEVKGNYSAENLDAVSFLQAHPNATEEELKKLKQSELLAICEALDLKANFNTGVDKLASKIAQELVIRNAKG